MTTRTARVVVIGGGAAGTSALYHLASRGWTDCLLLEMAELTSGSTWHAAGNCPTFSTSWTVMRVQAYGAQLYRRLEAETPGGIGYHGTGSLRLAHGRERMDEYRHVRAVARAQGLGYELLAPLQGNEMLLWLDITTQPDNLAALERARDADQPSMSAPFQLTQFSDTGDAGLGITVRLPVYSRGRVPETVEERRARETGALAMSLRLEPLVRNALQGRILEYMHVGLRDLGAAGNGHVFASGSPPADAPGWCRTSKVPHQFRSNTHGRRAGAQ